jgi:hypothetical protein
MHNTQHYHRKTRVDTRMPIELKAYRSGTPWSIMLKVDELLLGLAVATALLCTRTRQTQPTKPTVLM